MHLNVLPQVKPLGQKNDLGHATKMGHEVALAEDGQQALAVFKEAFDAGKPFDAVILDLTVPGEMGGKETMRQLATLDP